MAVLRAALNALLFLPDPTILETPASRGLDHREVELETGDRERLHGWWIEARGERLGHLLHFHGNGGNVGDRVAYAELLAGAGFDLLLFDYRGYGLSSGRPSEEGTYRDARAALDCLLGQPGVDPARVIYFGESLGGAIAIELALEHPPARLVLLSTFTSIRQMARLHYPFIPAALVPPAYPSLDRIRRLRAPLLVLHGDRDPVVPLRHGKDLFEAAPGPKRMHVLRGTGHDDVLLTARADFVREITSWASTERDPSPT